MNKKFIDFLMGFPVLIAVTISEFLVTLPFETPAQTAAGNESWLISRELLLTSLPALIITYLFARFLHTKDRAAALQHSIFWTSVLFLNYLVIGYGNGNLGAIFGTVGIYVLLACTFLGPVAYAKIKRLK